MKALHLWWMDGEGEWLFQGGYRDYARHVLAFRSIRVLNQIYYWLLLGLAAASLAAYAGRSRSSSPWYASGWLLILYTTAISTVFSGQTRYHFSLMPWIAIYASTMLVNLFVQSRSRPSAPAPVPQLTPGRLRPSRSIGTPQKRATEADLPHDGGTDHF